MQPKMPTPGVAETLEPGLRRILAPNPSPMTYWGTNTYLLGTRDIAVIDPGPGDAQHQAAILDAIGPGQRISHIIVTHAHLDHSPLARPLAQATGAPVLAFGDALAGRSQIMHALAATGLAGGGEGVDADFTPDTILTDGDVIETNEWALEVWHSPGHFGNHISLLWGDVAFVGDLVMGWSGSLVSPPDGDLTDFMASCRRMTARSWRVFHTGHGAPISEPNARLSWLIEHREAREAQILEALSEGAATAEALARRIYTDTDPRLIPAATRNVLAHLIDLTQRARVSPIGSLDQNAEFKRLAGS